MATKPKNKPRIFTFKLQGDIFGIAPNGNIHWVNDDDDGDPTELGALVLTAAEAVSLNKQLQSIPALEKAKDAARKKSAAAEEAFNAASDAFEEAEEAFNAAMEYPEPESTGTGETIKIDTDDLQLCIGCKSIPAKAVARFAKLCAARASRNRGTRKTQANANKRR